MILDMRYTSLVAKKASGSRVNTIFRMPADLHKQVVRAAKSEERSINNMLILLVRAGLKTLKSR